MGPPRVVRPRSAAFRCRRSAPLALLAACLALLIGGCRPSAREERTRPNVLLIVVDTLRWDHVGSYGAERETTPAIDRLAAAGVRFERAYSTAPWTIPSVASMISGMYPSRHQTVSFDSKLPTEVDTLAEILGGSGYATAGVVSHEAIGSERQFDQGYEVFHESEARGHEYLSTPGVTRQAIELLDRLALEERPFFLFVHYFDPHYRYLHHPEIGFARPPVGRLRGGERISDLRRIERDLTADELRFLDALYDEEIRFTDAGIGRLLAQLEQLGLAEDTLVVFTADHGEEFMDHGHLGHTATLYDELVRVPLIVRHPHLAGAGSVVAQPVSLVALTPTILDLVGAPAPEKGQAESFGALLEGSALESSRPVFCEVDFVPIWKGRLVEEVHKKAVVGSRYKLIRDDTSGKIELYDVLRDPHERDDLAATQPERVATLVDELDASMRYAASEALARSLKSVDPQEIEQLKALGYVGD